MSTGSLHRHKIIQRVVQRWTLFVSLAVVLGILLANFLALSLSAVVLIRFPFGVDYGEGIVWQQMRNIVHGTGYAPLGVFPAIVYHYPPVYHLAVAGASALFHIDELSTGRTVSWLCTLGTATITGWLATRTADTRSSIGTALVILLTATVFTSCVPVAQWAAVMRVDMLACLFSVSGIALTFLAIGKPRLLICAALVFVLAFYTKQTSLAAPIAAFLGLLATRYRQALSLGAIGLASGTVVLLLLSWITHGGFLRHIFFYNINRLQPDALFSLIVPLQDHLIYVALAVGGSASLIKQLRKKWLRRHTEALSIASAITVLCYFALKTLTLATIMKSGASSNYLIEWFCALAILVGVAVAPTIELVIEFPQNENAAKSMLLPFALLIAVAIQAYQLPRQVLTMENARAGARKMESLVGVVRSSTKPVLCDDMTVLIRAGREVQWEAAITAELGSKGVYDQSTFVDMIRQHRFGLFITEGNPGDPVFDSRYNPEVATAISKAYPQTWNIGHFTIHAPGKAT